MALRLRICALRVIAIFALASVLIGCGSDSELQDTDRDVAIYRSIIADVADRSDLGPNDSEDLPLLFIESFGADGIGLEVQVEVVASFIEQYEIRFIDDREEAIEIDLPGLPVRPNSLFLGLGPIVLDGTADIRSERYLSTDAISAYRYSLAGRGASWSIVGAPEEIEPEGFVSAS
jgi:hypothetical protein